VGRLLQRSRSYNARIVQYDETVTTRSSKEAFYGLFSIIAINKIHDIDLELQKISARLFTELAKHTILKPSTMPRSTIYGIPLPKSLRDRIYGIPSRRGTKSYSTQYKNLAGLMRIDMLNGDYTGSLINILDSAFGDMLRILPEANHIKCIQ
jgi:hypothetical protein